MRRPSRPRAVRWPQNVAQTAHDRGRSIRVLVIRTDQPATHCTSHLHRAPKRLDPTAAIGPKRSAAATWQPCRVNRSRRWQALPVLPAPIRVLLHAIMQHEVSSSKIPRAAAHSTWASQLLLSQLHLPQICIESRFLATGVWKEFSFDNNLLLCRWGDHPNSVIRGTFITCSLALGYFS